MDARIRLGGALGVLAVSLLTGCSSTVAGTGTVDLAAAAAASTPGTPAGSPSGTAGDLGSDLEEIAIQEGELAPGYTIQLIPGGAKVDDQVTLEHCEFDFTTEAHRVARRQYEILAPDSADTGLSNEVVAYDTPAQAARAVTEWHTAAATCPTTPVKSRVEGVPDMLIKVTRNDRDAATLPAEPNAITAETVTVSGEVYYALTVLQVHDRYLSAVYLGSEAPITGEELRTTLAFAVATGSRLTER